MPKDRVLNESYAVQKLCRPLRRVCPLETVEWTVRNCPVKIIFVTKALLD